MVFKGTILEKKSFCAERAAKILWKAIDGLGTDEDTIIEVVGSCNNYQRQLIKLAFFKIYQKDIIKELNSELRIRLSPDFRQLLRSLFMSTVEFDVHCLKLCVKGLGTDEKALVEILLTRSPDDLEKARVEYPKRFGVSLEEDIAQDTSGDFRKTVFPLSRVKRKPSNNRLDKDKAHRTAQEIDRSFTQFRGTEEPRFDLIGFCCRESFPQMLVTFSEYERITGRSIIKLIKREFNGDCEWALKCAVKCAHSVPGFLADRLKKCFGIATDDDTLSRIIVSRTEIDLEDVKMEFFDRYGKTLEWEVERHTKGYFKKLLLSLLVGNKHL